MLGYSWTFIIFGVMWVVIAVGYRGLLRVLAQREGQDEKGADSWTIGL